MSIATDDIIDALRIKQKALVSTNDLWDGIKLERHQIPANMEMQAQSHQQHIISIINSPKVTIERYEGKKIIKDTFLQGDIGFYPSGEYGKVTWKNDADVIHIHLKHSFLETAIEKKFETPAPEFPERFKCVDPLIKEIGFSLLNQAEVNDASNNLYVDSATQFLTQHLYKYYANQPLVIHEQRKGLSKKSLNAVLDYIHANLTNNIMLHSMADIANISEFHFSRQFKLSTGFTPLQYTMRKRVELAKNLLKSGKMTLAEASYFTGFFDQSHFTKQFKAIVGVTPKQFLEN